MHSRRTGWLIAAVLTVIFGVAVLSFYNSSSFRARLAYRDGLRRQLAGDLAGAREQYALCLHYDPTFGLAAFSMGTTYLGLGDPAVIQSIQRLTDAAVRGDTASIDLADHWFAESIRLAEALPPGRRLIDQRISTPRRLKAYARACLALTALIRASAALQADQLEDGMAWLQKSGQEAQGALLDDPENSAADRILKSVAPRL